MSHEMSENAQCAALTVRISFLLPKLGGFFCSAVEEFITKAHDFMAESLSSLLLFERWNYIKVRDKQRGLSFNG